MKPFSITVARADRLPPERAQFAHAIAESTLRAGPVDDHVADLMIDRLIDSVAIAIGGCTTTTVGRAYAQAATHPHTAGATLIGAAPDQRVHAEWAAYANCTAVRTLDWSDTAGGADFAHPSDCFGPIVATAQQARRSGADVVRAAAHAYQILVALTNALPLHEHGIDQFANLGAAVPAGLGSLLELPTDVVHQAVQLSAYLATTTFQVRSGHVSSWKANGPGFVGKTAIEAVDRAMRGEDAPTPFYEGRFGALAVLLGGDDASFDVDLLQPGEPPRLAEQSFPKQWPVEYMAQVFVDLALIVRERIADLDQIDRIVVTGSQNMHDVIGSADPQHYDPDATRGTLDHSLMFILAIALQDGAVDFLDSFTTERVHRPDTVALWRKIRTQPSDEWTRAGLERDPAKKKSGGQIEVTMHDGTVMDERLDNAHSYNFPTPWRRSDYVEKFHTITDRFLGDGEGARFLNLALRLPELTADELLVLYPRLRPGVLRDGGHGVFG